MAFGQNKNFVSEVLRLTQTGEIRYDVPNSTQIVLDIRPVVFQPIGGGTGVVAPPEAFTGRYILIGTLCYFSFQVDFDLITDFGTGQYFMNLPFPTLENMITREGNLNDASEGEQYHITGLATSGSSQLNLFFSDKVSSGVQDNPFKQGSPITLTTADSFHIEGIYEADLS
jgi:hypothetical protein